MKKLAAVLLILATLSIPASAEIRSIDITIFGMD
jgi:hypothetical protein